MCKHLTYKSYTNYKLIINTLTILYTSLKASPTLIFKDVFLQADHVIEDAHLPNGVTHPASHDLVSADVDLYDLQRLAVPGRRDRSRRRILHVWLEEIRYR